MKKDIVEIVTKNSAETEKLGELLAKTIQGGGATIISLEGDLGAGKTTFTKGFATGLGIRDTIQSPTFVILKLYSVKHRVFDRFVHIDAYRIGVKDLPTLGWDEFIKDRKNIILIEWGDRIKKALPKNTLHIRFRHNKKDKRIITIKN